MLSSASRALVYLVAVLYALLGAALFFLPERLAPVFAWQVTGFMTMTIGVWCLGNAWLAFLTARRWEWKRVYPALIYLWTFGVLETLVVIAFRARLQLIHPVGWLYVITLAINVLLAISGVIDWVRLRPVAVSSEPMTRLARVLSTGFVGFVGWLGMYGLIAQTGWLGTNGEIFPEIMSPFTLRSFGAFYFSLTVGAVPLLFEKSIVPFLNYTFLAFGLIVIITIAAFVYFPLFDFSSHPFGLLYFAAYLLAGIFSIVMLVRHGTGFSRI